MNGYVSYNTKDKRNYYVKAFVEAVEEHHLNYPMPVILEEVNTWAVQMSSGGFSVESQETLTYKKSENGFPRPTAKRGRKKSD